MLVGYSMSLISVLGAVGGALLLFWGLRAFAQTHREVAEQGP
jgi:uncharacterized membrane protein YdjX (TVP38/TMEM64 family)